MKKKIIHLDDINFDEDIKVSNLIEKLENIIDIYGDGWLTLDAGYNNIFGYLELENDGAGRQIG